MPYHRLLGIFLHAAVDGGIDFQSVGIHIVMLSFAVGILVAPAIQRVGLPSQRVFIEILPLPTGIITALWLLGHKYAAKHLTQIGCTSLLVIYAMEFQRERLLTELLCLGLRQVPGFLHL